MSPDQGAATGPPDVAGGAAEPFGQRLCWQDLPVQVRDQVAALLGAPVVRAAAQCGGFSPGTADRVVTAAGRRAFVKVVGTGLNPDSPELLAREARVLTVLPPGTGAPTLLGSLQVEVDGERWVALAVEDIEGRHPHTPWRPAEVAAALDTLERLAGFAVPTGTDLPRLTDELGPVLGEARADLLDGAAVVHLDVRSDNLLVAPDGTTRLVDWPWACVGAPWVDSLLLLLNVRLFGGADASAYLPRVRALGARERDIRSVLTGLADFFGHLGELPPPPGLPTLRTFQRVQSEAAQAWLRELPDRRK